MCEYAIEVENLLSLAPIGMIKNFDNKLNEKDKEYSMFDDEQIETLNASNKVINVASDSILGKVFGYFFDN